MHRLADRTGQLTTKLDRTFGFVPIPAGPSGAAATLAGGMAYAIFRQAARPDLAGRLLQRLVAPEALADMARSTGQIPPRRSAVPLSTPDLGFLAATAGLLENAVTRPVTRVYARVSDQLQVMLEAVLTHRLNPSAAVVRPADRIGAITGLPVEHGERCANEWCVKLIWESAKARHSLREAPILWSVKLSVAGFGVGGGIGASRGR